MALNPYFPQDISRITRDNSFHDNVAINENVHRNNVIMAGNVVMVLAMTMFVVWNILARL